MEEDTQQHSESNVAFAHSRHPIIARARVGLRPLASRFWSTVDSWHTFSRNVERTSAKNLRFTTSTT